MSAGETFILAVTLGPVGRFISGGRRSRDLWFGSRYLSEVTFEAASAILQVAGDGMIVPTRERMDQRLSPFIAIDHRKPTISNRILARVSGDVEEIARGAEQRARRFLAAQLNELRYWAQPERRDVFSRVLIHEREFDGQRDAILAGDFLEFYAAWVPEGSGSLGDAIRRAMALLDARKNTRTFVRPTWTMPGAPKSALDPGRDSVLIEVDPNGDPDRQEVIEVRNSRAGIRGGERLDAIGLLRRRAAFQTRRNGKLPELPFPPLARVAAEPWLQGARRTVPTTLDQIAGELRKLDDQSGNHDDALFRISSPVREPARGAFEYDPSLMFEGALAALAKSIGQVRRPRAYVYPHGEPVAIAPPDIKAAQDADAVAGEALAALKEPIATLHAAMGAPPIPYYAMLFADGDGIGSALSDVAADGYRKELVEGLYRFADDAWEKIIDKPEHAGCAFYAAGDELAAYFPVDTALAAAQALASLFDQCMTTAVPSFPRKLTLSIGVVIAPIREDLRQIRRLAHDALDAAKKERREANSQKSWIRVEEVPRAGSRRWASGPTAQFVDRMARWRLLLGDPGGSSTSASRDSELSLSLAHDLLALAEKFADSREDTNGANDTGIVLAKALVQQKAERAGRQLRSDQGIARPAASGDPLAALAAVTNWSGVRALATEMLIAERINRIDDQRREPPPTAAPGEAGAKR